VAPARRVTSRTVADPRQDDLLAPRYAPPPMPALRPGSLSMAAEVCGTLSLAIRQTDLSRAQVAAAMSDLTGDTITVPMLNAWTAESHEAHRFPFQFAAAFEAACETTALQLLLASRRGSVVLVGREALDAELGRVRRQKAELSRKERELVSIMGAAR
jgi:hypothetical protein